MTMGRGESSKKYNSPPLRQIEIFERHKLVKVQNATKRVRKARSLSVEQFHALLEAIGADVCWRTMLLVLGATHKRPSSACLK